MTKLEDILKGVSNELPVGSITTHQGGDIPDGWLVCNGERIFKTDYPELARAINYQHGNFNLPDMRGSFPRQMMTEVDMNGEPTSAPKEFNIIHIIRAK